MRTKKILLLLSLTCFLLPSCFHRLDDFYKAKKFLSKKKCKESFKYFLQSNHNEKIKKSFALQAGKLCFEEKKYLDSVLFYEYLISVLSNEEQEKKQEILDLKEKVVKIYFQNKYYKKALSYFESLLGEEITEEQRFEYLYKSSQAFFHLGKKKQALKEIKKSISLKKIKKAKKIDAVLFQSRVVFSLDKTFKKIDFFRNQMKIFPEKEEVFRNYIIFILEEKNDIESAIKELEMLKKKDQKTKKKIKSLKLRLSRKIK